MHRTKHWLENRVGPSMSQEQLLLPKVFACWLLEVMLVCVCACAVQTSNVWLRSPLVNLEAGHEE